MKRKSLTILFIIAAALLAAYLCVALYFHGHFFPGSSVNGISSSGATVDMVKTALEDQAKNYYLTIEERDGKQERISSADAGLSIDLSGGQVEKLLAKQNVFTWPAAVFQKKAYESETLSEVDGTKLRSAVNALSCVTDPNATETEDATYRYENGAYSVKEEVYGTRLDPDTLYAAVKDAMENFSDTVDLDADKIYVQPKVTKDSPELVSLVDDLNKRLSMKITYTDVGETMSKDTLAGILSADEKDKLSVNQEAVSAYVNSLEKKYNTAGRSKKLVTSYGTTVTVPGGNYGWKVDAAGETAKLTEEIEKGEDVSRSITWARTAASHGANDYGDSYVEINLTSQHLFLYKNGTRVLDTPIVSGNVTRGDTTPAGAYGITYMDKDAMLTGEWHVNYWMPFNGNIGMHDAYWKSNFGGGEYITKGSHGCINLPMNMSPKVFAQVAAGFPVLLYTLPGTEDYDTAAVTNAENLISAIGPVSTASGPAIAAAADAYNALDVKAKPAVTNAKALTAAQQAFAALPKTAGTVAAAPVQ